MTTGTYKNEMAFNCACEFYFALKKARSSFGADNASGASTRPLVAQSLIAGQDVTLSAVHGGSEIFGLCGQISSFVFSVNSQPLTCPKEAWQWKDPLTL